MTVNNSRKIEVVVFLALLTTSVGILVSLKILGYRAQCGWGFTKNNWTCRCLGIKVIEEQEGLSTRIYCTGLNLSNNKLNKLPLILQQPINDQKNVQTPNPYPIDISEKEGISATKDITLQPDTDWVKAEFCGVNHKIHPSFKKILAVQGETYGDECTFGYNYNEIAGTIVPVEIRVAVYNNYNGGSRRAFFFNKLSQKGINYTSPTGQFLYSGTENFTAGNNLGLKLIFADNDLGDGSAPYNYYLIALDAKTLVVVGSENGYENGVVKMFLTSLGK